jgi:tryptophan synthase alpha chain
MAEAEGAGGPGVPQAGADHPRVGTAVSAAFEKAAAEDRAALIGYVPAGFPSVTGAIGAAIAMAEAGADIVEIGLPYSDPLIDGSVIQDAVHRALTGGVRVADVLSTVREVAAAGVPALVMTYWNPVDSFGVREFAAELARAGGSGMITPDLTPEEGGPWLAAAAEYGLDPVFLVAPSSPRRRIQLITSVCGGFVYAASLMGTTGTRDVVGAQAEDLVRRVRDCTRLPVAVGLGVSNGRQAAQVAGFADGVIVGTAFVKRLLAASDLRAGIESVSRLAAELADGVRSRQAASASRSPRVADQHR